MTETGARVLVTGAAGQLGQYLLTALRRAGYQPLGLGRSEGPGVDVIADIRDRAADLHLGPMLDHFVLVVPEPDALRHDSPPAVGSLVSELRTCRSLASIS